IKGMFQDALDSQTPSTWAIYSTYCDVIRRQADVATSMAMAGKDYDIDAEIKSTTAEYAAVLLDHVTQQVHDYLESGDTDEPFYLKSLIRDEDGLKQLANFDLDDHSQLAVFALRGVANRFRGNHEGRIKAGRVLSERNRSRIYTLMQQM